MWSSAARCANSNSSSATWRERTERQQRSERRGPRRHRHRRGVRCSRRGAPDLRRRTGCDQNRFGPSRRGELQHRRDRRGAARMQRAERPRAPPGRGVGGPARFDGRAAPGRARSDASVLPRAVQTATLLRRCVGDGTLAIHEDCDLCELHPGQADGLGWQEVVDRFGVPEWDRDPDRPIAPGGESWSGFVTRAAGAVRRLAERHSGELVVAAVHAGVIEASMIGFLAIPPSAHRRGWARVLHASMTDWEWDPEAQRSASCVSTTPTGCRAGYRAKRLPSKATRRARAVPACQLRKNSATWNARSSDWRALRRGSQVVV